ncbi:hypothetical protein ACH5RR_016165 [Cinchona calisaya]|uniref:F-box domain-containing protein n=1 Tax=Cinchona calisaya TaxID=153742 RepID=A0ABD2ZX66_9GENT
MMKSTYYIPLDPMVQVLARIPALMRFMCVCKSWYSIIRDPQFAELHRTYSQTRSNGNYLTDIWYCYWKKHLRIYCVDHAEGPTVDQQHPIELDLGDVISATRPLDGLVCVYSHHPSCRAFVLNISTRQVVSLPVTCFPVYVSCVYSLGFDPLTNDYKVLNIVHVKSNDGLIQRTGEIYTLGTASRRKLKNLPPGDLTCTSPSNESEHLLAIGGQLAILQICNQRKIISIWILEDHKNQVLVKEKIDFPDDLEIQDWMPFGGISPSGTHVSLLKFFPFPL